MTVLTFLARVDLHRRVEKALGSQFVMDDVASAKECLQMARLAPYEGVLIDSDPLIFVNVLALVKLLRHESSDTSIFIFSRCLDLEQRLSLFEAGVDDCVCEPFFASEMAVRLGLSIRLRQAASDLGASGTANVLRSGDLELDLVRRTAARSGKAIDLSPKEFLLLEYLVRNVNRPVTRTMILERVLEILIRGFDQRSRCVYQRPALQGRSRLSSEVDSDQPWHRLHLHLQQRGAQAAPVLAAAWLSPRRLRQQTTPIPSAIIGKGRSGRQ